MNWAEESLTSLMPFIISLCIGLLIGLERERNPTARGGLRTFSLVALSGCLAALIGTQLAAPWIIAAGLIVLGGMMIATYFRRPDPADPGTTTIAAVVVCYSLGVMVWLGYLQLAVTLAILTTVLLYFKPELRGVSQTLSRRDILSILQFGVLSLVILPILPNQGYGPFAALNPRQVWWMVVLVSGLSLAGYAALRLAGQRHGVLLTGLLGGAASSTATTLAFSRHVKNDADLAPQAALIILLANWALLIRLTIIVAVVTPALLVDVLWLLGGGLLAGFIHLAYLWRELGKNTAGPHPQNRRNAPELIITNPAEIGPALTFGALYGVILLAAAWLTHNASAQGIYVLAGVSGLTDLDAIALSSLRLANLGSIDANTVLTVLLVALCANMLFKGSLAWSIGHTALIRRVGPGYLFIAAGLGAGLALS